VQAKHEEDISRKDAKTQRRREEQEKEKRSALGTSINALSSLCASASLREPLLAASRLENYGTDTFSVSSGISSNGRGRKMGTDHVFHQRISND
jgi:hypothetical protein